MHRIFGYIHPQHVADAAVASVYVSSLGGVSQLIGVLFPAIYFAVKTWESETIQKLFGRVPPQAPTEE